MVEDGSHKTRKHKIIIIIIKEYRDKKNEEKKKDNEEEEATYGSWGKVAPRHVIVQK